MFRRKSNRVEPLDADDTDGSDVSDVDNQDTRGEKKAGKNEDEQIIEENTASAEKLAEKATSQVNDDNKLRPGDQPQGQSRSKFMDALLVKQRNAKDGESQCHVFECLITKQF